MTAQQLSSPSEDVLVEVAGDAAMVSLLRGKPAAEVVPTTVWWLVAEALRTTVAARRRLYRPPGADDEDVSVLLVEAALLTDAALVELADSTELDPGQVDAFATAEPSGWSGLQRGTLRLVRLLVSHRATSPERLAAALRLHADALRAQLLQRQAG
ncbi:MAG TPA: hypothetical protein VHW92_00385 [Mycobacteriales bacterium]|jgi:hypothetical protein|nr:hypothetical protein [Mycobacteriales bacterium]